MNYCTAFLLAGNKEDFLKRKGILSLSDTGEVMGQSDMMVAYPAYISCGSRMVRIVITNVHRLRRTLFFNCDNGVENHTCHNNVTRPFWGDPEPTKALEPGLEHPKWSSLPGLVSCSELQRCCWWCGLHWSLQCRTVISCSTVPVLWSIFIIWNAKG